jgi:cytoskeleton protein RodZ
MAGIRPSTLGIGSALRRAREIRGVPLEAAARDTRLSLDRLRALEEEDFDALPGEVYVRASLRTYAQYLGLDPVKVLGAYARHADEPEPPPPPAKLGRVEQALAAARIRDSQRFFLIAAVVVLVALVAVGLVSRRAAPEVAELEAETPSGTAPSPEVPTFSVVVLALGEVDVASAIDDDETVEVTLAADETYSFSAAEQVALTVSRGDLVRVTVAGVDMGVPSSEGGPWSVTYTAASASAIAASASPSPAETSAPTPGNEPGSEEA